MKQIARALRLFGRQKEIRHYLWRPLAISLAVFMLAGVAASWLFAGALSALAGSLGLPAQAGAAAGIFLSAAAFLFLSGPIFVVVSSLISSFHWDPLGRKVESLTGGREDFPASPPAFFIKEIVLRGLFAVLVLGITVPLLFTPAAPAAALLAGLLAFSDFTGAAYQRRGVPFPQALVRALRSKGSASLWLSCAAASLLPLLFVFLHPLFAAAGTLHVADQEG